MDAVLHLPAPAAAAAVPEIRWEQTDCLLCGSPRWQRVLEAPGAEPVAAGHLLNLVRCQRCGLSFTNPRPTEESIGRFYPADYGPHVHCGLGPSQRRRARWWGRMPARWQARSPERHGVPWQGAGRLLDFGCGGGGFLQRAQLQGWNVLGLDASLSAVQRIRAELRLPALAGTLPHAELAPGSFDVVTMWASLEHVHRPLEVLRAAWQVLAPGGRLYVLVPNVESGPRRWFGPAWYPLQLPLHLTHFSRRTLGQMAARAGFQVESLRVLPETAWLQSSARLARQQQRGPVWLRWLEHRALGRLVAGYLQLMGQSDGLLLVARREAGSVESES